MLFSIKNASRTEKSDLRFLWYTRLESNQRHIASEAIALSI